MKQVVASAGKVTVVDVPAPTCGDGEVLVKSSFSLISTGTESWTIEATEPLNTRQLVGNRSKLRKAVDLTTNVWKTEGLGGVADYVKFVRNPQVPLGYSVSGVVVQIGKSVVDVVVGDTVACAGEGKACHAEFVAVPRNLLAKLPAGVDTQDAAFGTVGAIALHGFRRSGAQIGETVGVIGAGLVGNLIVQIAKAAGCRVIAIDTREDRLDLARHVGADLTIPSSDQRLAEHVLNFSGGKGLDSVIVCAATDKSDPVNLASKLARDRASVTVVGRVGMDFERKDYFQKELDIVMSRSLGPGRYDPSYEMKGVDYPVGYVRWTLARNVEGFLMLLAEKKVNVKDLVAGVYPVEEASSAYSSLRGSSKVAVLLRYPEATAREEPARSGVLVQRKSKAQVQVALVGPGNFAKEIMIPALRRNPAFNLRWIVSSNPLNAKRLGERYRFEKYGTEYLEVLKDDDLDLVIIATPNNMHHLMLVDAAKAGKAAFVEKPLCISEEQLADIVKVQNETGTPIIVGFNRRYSPLALKLREEMDKLDGPFLINYRVNADYILPSRWVQDPEVGGGRIIAECCHFFDLFNFLLRSRNPEVQVSSTSVTDSTTVTRDNLVAVLKYQNGSVASLTYSALGNRSMERERLEVFGQGTAFVLDDFKTLEVFEPSGVRRFSKGSPDKGHAAELVEVEKLLRGKPSSAIPFEEAVESTRLTFTVEALARGQTGRTNEAPAN
ncbi:MAG: bi-domain-containing oxidoreductase [Thaumarchaeota archaeon]|nr:bi-domain-containing oxidoreductase [Nitrososphaerota archaeon]